MAGFWNDKVNSKITRTHTFRRISERALNKSTADKSEVQVSELDDEDVKNDCGIIICTLDEFAYLESRWRVTQFTSCKQRVLITFLNFIFLEAKLLSCPR